MHPLLIFLLALCFAVSSLMSIKAQERWLNRQHFLSLEEGCKAIFVYAGSLFLVIALLPENPAPPELTVWLVTTICLSVVIPIGLIWRLRRKPAPAEPLLLPI